MKLPKWSTFQGRLEGLGPDVKRFLKSEAGQAFVAALVEKHKDLAVEAMDSPAEGVSQDYYRGQRAAVAWMAAQLSQMALLEPSEPMPEMGPALMGGFSDGSTA